MKWLSNNFLRVFLFLVLTADVYAYFGWRGLMVWATFCAFFNLQVEFIIGRIRIVPEKK